MFSVRTLAKYPFLKEAGAYIRERGPPLGELLGDMAYEEARLRGKARLMEALSQGAIGDHPLTSEPECNLELYSYPIARILVSSIPDEFLIHRYVLAEAVKASERLEKEDDETVLGICAELGLDISSDGATKMHFIDYIRNSAQMRAKEWSLVNQRLEKGYVHISRPMLLRLVQQAVQRKMDDELPLEVNDEILGVMEPYLVDVREELSRRKAKYKAEDLGKVSITRMPPCMRRFISMLQSGENLPHSARFALTAFLRAIGMDNEDILRLFASAPDFDERKTRYQVEHITGRVSGTQYTPPECGTMRSYNICFDPDDLCRRDWMKHPLTYYRIKGRKPGEGGSRRSGDKKESAGDEAGE